MLVALLQVQHDGKCALNRKGAVTNANAAGDHISSSTRLMYMISFVDISA
jgi:hypothetical protein